MCASSFKFLIRLFADGRLLKQTLAYLPAIICSNISSTRKGLNHRVSRYAAFAPLSNYTFQSTDAPATDRCLTNFAV